MILFEYSIATDLLLKFLDSYSILLILFLKMKLHTETFSQDFPIKFILVVVVVGPDGAGGSNDQFKHHKIT